MTDLDIIERQIAWLRVQSATCTSDHTRRELLARVRQIKRELERLVPEVKIEP